jgi:histidinol-phosphate/aromatic aminotransferase/cobyric acid decarboxylase-like protein
MRHLPGLGADYLRVAVRDPHTNSGFAAALADLMGHPA